MKFWREVKFYRWLFWLYDIWSLECDTGNDNDNDTGDNDTGCKGDTDEDKGWG